MTVHDEHRIVNPILIGAEPRSGCQFMMNTGRDQGKRGSCWSPIRMVMLIRALLAQLLDLRKRPTTGPRPLHMVIMTSRHHQPHPVTTGVSA